jgi:hypothetical protein
MNANVLSRFIEKLLAEHPSNNLKIYFHAGLHQSISHLQFNDKGQIAVVF